VQQANIPYLIGRGYFKDSARGQIIGDAQGLLKLIVDTCNEKLLQLSDARSLLQARRTRLHALTGTAKKG
jgi:hypothetical protein